MSSEMTRNELLQHAIEQAKEAILASAPKSATRYRKRADADQQRAAI